MLGRYIKATREARGWTQRDVAERMRMEQAEFSKWERGDRKRPSPEQIVQIAHGLQVPVRNVAMAYAGIWPDAEDAEPRFWDVVVIPSDTDAEQRELLMVQIAGIGPVLLRESQRWARGEATGVGEPVPQPLPVGTRRGA